MIARANPNNIGPKGPILQVPAGWLVSEAMGTFSHEKRKYMMLLLMAAKEACGASSSHKHDHLDLYGESEYQYGGTADSALVQLENEGYIEIDDEEIISLTEKTRHLFTMEAVHG